MMTAYRIFHASGGPLAIAQLLFFSLVEPLARDADDCRASGVAFVTQY
jgi:hypothetical protein